MITVTDAHSGQVIARHAPPVDEAAALRAELLAAYYVIKALAEAHGDAAQAFARHADGRLVALRRLVEAAS